MANVENDVRAKLEKQLSDLQNEVAKLGKSFADRASDAMDYAGDALDEGKGHARQVVRQAREQAHVVADAARENPATAATVVTAVGLLGLLAGFALGGLLASDGRRR